MPPRRHVKCRNLEESVMVYFMSRMTLIMAYFMIAIVTIVLILSETNSMYLALLASILYLYGWLIIDLLDNDNNI